MHDNLGLTLSAADTGYGGQALGGVQAGESEGQGHLEMYSEYGLCETLSEK